MWRWPRSRDEHGAAPVDFVLVMVVLVPLVLGVLQLILVLYVRNTATSAAAEGARVAAAAGPAAGVARTRAVLREVLADRFAEDVEARWVRAQGTRMVELRVRLVVPALGLGGPGVGLTVRGRAIEEPVR